MALTCKQSRDPCRNGGCLAGSGHSSQKFEEDSIVGHGVDNSGHREQTPKQTEQKKNRITFIFHSKRKHEISQNLTSVHLSSKNF